MLGVGWTEMLVIGVVALIVIGPKELPALMQKLGRFAGTVRRMGADFQRELNRTTGLDEVKNLRNAITQPLKQTTDAIRREFNTTTPSGAVQPSGALSPADPKAESVVSEIHKAAGMTPAEAEPVKAAPPASEPVKAAPVEAAPPASEPVKAAPVKAATVVAPSTASPPATSPEPGASKPKRVRKPRAPKVAASPASGAAAPAESAKRPGRPRKAAAKKS